MTTAATQSPRAAVAAAIAKVQRCGSACNAAPYGIIEGTHGSGYGRKARAITFGVARYIDATILVWSPTYIILKSSRSGQHKFESQQALLDYLAETPIP